MADIALTAAQIKVVFPMKAEVYDFVAAVAITRGQIVYINSSGLVALGDGSAAATAQPVMLALTNAAAGDAVSCLKQGTVAGFTLGTKGAAVYLSDTAGKLADAAGTVSVPLGRVVNLPDKPNYTEYLYFEANWNVIYA